MGMHLVVWPKPQSRGAIKILKNCLSDTYFFLLDIVTLNYYFRKSIINEKNKPNIYFIVLSYYDYILWLWCYRKIEWK